VKGETWEGNREAGAIEMDAAGQRDAVSRLFFGAC